MGLFSKKICAICGEKAGLLSRLSSRTMTSSAVTAKRSFPHSLITKTRFILKKRYATTSHGANRRGKKSLHSKRTIAFN